MSDDFEENKEEKPESVWAATWINLINNINNYWCQGKYSESWDSLRLLFHWLPQECKEETKTVFDQVTSNLNKLRKQIAGHDSYTHIKSWTRIRNNYLFPVILDVCGEVQASLERNGWISRGRGFSGINPNKKADEL